MEKGGGENRVRLLQDVLERGGHPAQDGPGDHLDRSLADGGHKAGYTHPHRLRVLVCQQGEQGGEAAQPSGKQDEEGKLLLRVDRDLVEHR